MCAHAGAPTRRKLTFSSAPSAAETCRSCSGISPGGHRFPLLFQPKAQRSPVQQRRKSAVLTGRAGEASMWPLEGPGIRDSANPIHSGEDSEVRAAVAPALGRTGG